MHAWAENNVYLIIKSFVLSIQMMLSIQMTMRQVLARKGRACMDSEVYEVMYTLDQLAVFANKKR